MVQDRHLIGRGLAGLSASHNESDPTRGCRAWDAGVLAAQYGVLFAPNFFKGMIDGASTPAAVLKMFQPDGLHPNAKGVRSIVKGLGPDVERLLDEIEAGS